MGKYVVHQGEVVKCKNIHLHGNKRMSFETISGVVVNGANEVYYCDKFGKSLIDGEYYNYKDDFFPWENGVFKKRKIKGEIR